MHHNTNSLRRWQPADAGQRADSVLAADSAEQAQPVPPEPVGFEPGSGAAAEARRVPAAARSADAAAHCHPASEPDPAAAVAAGADGVQPVHAPAAPEAGRDAAQGRFSHVDAGGDAEPSSLSHAHDEELRPGAERVQLRARQRS